MNNIEKTLSIIKPDAVERNLQDQIKNEFKNNKENLFLKIFFVIFKNSKIACSEKSFFFEYLIWSFVSLG